MTDSRQHLKSRWCGFGTITLGGAVAEVADEATAFSGRGARWWLTAEALWHDRSGDEDHMTWGRRSYDRLCRVAVTENDVNDLGEPGEHDLREVYGPGRFERLVAQKRIWDPDNVFRRNQNIRP